jgi:photosystem II stability/assembly factor-like uncharacterized protein
MKKSILSVAVFLGLALGLNAQLWLQQGAGFTTSSRGFTNIFIVDPQVVWASAYDGSGGGAAVQDFTMTTNGGTTWTAKTISGVTGLNISMICAVSATTAWAAMWKASGSVNPGIYKTTDGGTTWTRQSTAAYTAPSFPDIVYFWDANVGVTMGDPVSGKFEIYTTSDGGTTWTVVPGANMTAPLSGETAWTSNYSVIGNTIWFGTSKGRVYKSTDQGHNWTATAVAGMTGKNTFAAYQDANTGFCMKFYSAADTSNLLDLSTDGGATYAPFTYAGPVYNQMINYVPGTANTYATIGVDATDQPDRLGFTYTTNGGTTWYSDVQMTGTQLTAECWLNDSTGWVSGFNTDATDGLFKFNNVLALNSDFMSPDTSILVFDTAHFTNMSDGRITSYQWTFQGGIPASSNAKTPPPVTYLQAGSWDVTLKVTGQLGSRTLKKTGYIHVGGVGINEHSKASITVYPNPARDFMSIKATASMQEIQVLNLLGQILINQPVSTQTYTLNTSMLKAGVYDLKIKMNDGFVNKKIVVN